MHAAQHKVSLSLESNLACFDGNIMITSVLLQFLSLAKLFYRRIALTNILEKILEQ